MGGCLRAREVISMTRTVWSRISGWRQGAWLLVTSEFGVEQLGKGLLYFLYPTRFSSVCHPIRAWLVTPLTRSSLPSSIAVRYATPLTCRSLNAGAVDHEMQIEEAI